MPELIKTNAGEQHSPSVLAEVRAVLAGRHALTALRAGSAVIARRGGRWIAAEPLMRGGAGAFFAYVAVEGAAQQPQALAVTAPAAVAAWAVAAWTLAPPVDVLPATAPEEPEERPVEAFSRWLLDLIGDRPGVHLAELYPAMRTLPGHDHHDDAALRDALRALDIPVRRSLRVGTVAGRSGVHRDDLMPLPSLRGEPGGEHGGDAGQGADSPAGERAESALESTR